MDNRSKEHIVKALKIADDLMDFANNTEAIGGGSSCRILFGVIRDCAYQIRRQAERERQALKAMGKRHPCVSEIKQSFNLKKLMMILGAALILGAAAAGPVKATIILSTDFSETLGGLSFDEGDLAEYNPTTDIATLYFDGDLFSGPLDIALVHVPGNGNIILSSLDDATLGGLTFIKKDFVKYNPTTDTATLFFNGSLFSGNADVDAAVVNRFLGCALRRCSGLRSE